MCMRMFMHGDLGIGCLLWVWLICYAVVLLSISLYSQLMLMPIHGYDYTRERQRGGLTWS